MSHSGIDRLRTHVRTFRAAHERWSSRETHPWTSDFPEGQCGNASRLLARYLTELGYSDIHIVSGASREDPKGGQRFTHAWLKVGRYVVDITCDQFADHPGDFVFAEETRFHNSFTGQTLTPYRDQPPHPLESRYQEIVALIY